VAFFLAVPGITKQTGGSNGKKAYTVKEIKAALQLDRMTIYRLLRERKLHGIKAGAVGACRVTRWRNSYEVAVVEVKKYLDKPHNAKKQNVPIGKIRDVSKFVGDPADTNVSMLTALNQRKDQHAHIIRTKRRRQSYVARFTS